MVCSCEKHGQKCSGACKCIIDDCENGEPVPNVLIREPEENESYDES